MKDIELSIAQACVPETRLELYYQQAQEEINSLRAAVDIGYEDERASIILPVDAGMRQWVNQCAQDYADTDVLIVIGIGGSNLGTLAVHEAVHGRYHNELSRPQAYFVDTVDPDKTQTILRIAQDRLKEGKRVVVNCISKSGTTTETISLFELFLDALTQHGRNLTKDVVITTDEGSVLWTLAQERGYMKFAIPKKVGGRFSVLSPVGLFPLAVLGVDIFALHAGATRMRERCLNDAKDNPAAQSAIALFHHANNGKPIHNTFFFSTELEELGVWYRQLLAESIGKEWNREHNKQVFTGITPTTSIGSTDLHSMAQLFLGGSNSTSHTFVTLRNHPEIRVPMDQRFEALVSHIQGQTLETILAAILGGVQHAFSEQQRPFITIALEDRSAHSIGQFLQLKMMEIMMLASMMGVNAFDQPNVESYKMRTKELLSNNKSAQPIYLGADHAGYDFKEQLKEHLDRRGIPYEDFGTGNPYQNDDYPEYAEKVARKVAQTHGRGILICGTGTGMVIAANKISGVRAVMAYDIYSAQKARSDNDANILALRGREFDYQYIPKIVDAFLDTQFTSNERYARRLDEIKRLEERHE